MRQELSQFGIGVTYDGTKMDDATVKLNGGTVLGTESAPVEIDLNVDNKITFDAANPYMMHILNATMTMMYCLLSIMTMLL